MGDAVVVGAGIGGLASALALRRAGWSVTVVERAQQSRPEGAALVLWPNAVRALRALGVADHVLAVATPHRLALGRRPDGRVLNRIDMTAVAAKLGDPAVTVLRADLQEILTEALSGVAVHTGTPVTGLRPGADSRPTVSAGTRMLVADLVVGADGLHSRIRAQMDVGGRIAVAPYLAWRAVVPADRAPRLDAGGETLGVRRRFGCASLGARGVYWYATLHGGLDERPAEDQLRDLRRALGDWHAPIPALLAATEAADLLHHEVTELRPPPRRFGIRVGSGAAVLVGDAAHAMTPNLGQGACLALEDAVTLGAVFGPDTGVDAGLRRYHQLRYRRATRLISQSRRVGMALEVTGPRAVWLRDQLMRALPDTVAARGVSGPADWRPPAG